MQVVSPVDCFKATTCHVLVTETPTAGPAPQIVIDDAAYNGANCFGTTTTNTFGNPTCDPGFQLGTCSTQLLGSVNGDTCTATPIAGTCQCQLVMTTPSDCTKDVSCSIVATEVPTGWDATCPSLVRF